MLSFLFSTLSLIVACVLACSCIMMHQVYLNTWVDLGFFLPQRFPVCHGCTAKLYAHVCVCVCVFYYTSETETKTSRLVVSNLGDLAAVYSCMTLLWTVLIFYSSLLPFDVLHTHVVHICLLVWLLFIWSNLSSIIITIIGHNIYRLYGNFDFYSLYLVKTNESNDFVLLPVRL